MFSGGVLYICGLAALLLVISPSPHRFKSHRRLNPADLPPPTSPSIEMLDETTPLRQFHPSWNYSSRPLVSPITDSLVSSQVTLPTRSSLRALLPPVSSYPPAPTVSPGRGRDDLPWVSLPLRCNPLLSALQPTDDACFLPSPLLPRWPSPAPPSLHRTRPVPPPSILLDES